MIALTQEQREELIAYANAAIKECDMHGEDYTPRPEMMIKALKVVLTSLTATAVGSFHIYDNKVDGTSDYIRDGGWPIDEGELVVYAAPPVPEIKLPPEFNESHDSFNEFGRGWNGAISEVKRTNGLGE